jgi:DNA-binding response OmpR family regulator
MSITHTTAAPRSDTGTERPLLLLVEDDPEVGSLIAEMLEDVDCDVLTATSGESALALLERHPVRLAIVDQSLPGMPGPVFVARARAGQPGLRALYISGAPLDAAATSDPVLLKPFRAAQLQATVTAMLQRPG